MYSIRINLILDYVDMQEHDFNEKFWYLIEYSFDLIVSLYLSKTALHLFLIVWNVI